MTDLLLYHAVPSRGMIVHWMLEELGEPYDLKVLDLQAEEQKTPEYLAVNPMGKVPALRHGDKIVTETAAICTYLAEAYPQAQLEVPIGSPLRGDYLRWVFFATATAETAVLWKALENQVADVEYQPFAEIETVASTLRTALKGREFIVGDRFTVADIMIGSTIMWGLNLMPVMPRHPEILAYWEGLEKRPAWQRAYADDQRYMTAK